MISNHVVYIIDSCYSPSANHKSNTEVLAACEGESMMERGRGSFTRAVSEVLRKQYPTPISIAHLHQQVFQNTCTVTRDTGLTTTPFHLELNENQEESLVIAPLVRPHSGIPNSPPPYDRPLLGDNPPKVLMRVHLAPGTPIPKGEMWIRWLAGFLPPYIRHTDVSLDSVYESSNSVVLLVSVSLAIFNVLARPGRGYQGIAYVKGENRLLPEPQASSQPLTSLPIRSLPIR